MKKRRDTLDHTRSVDLLRLERLHDIQEFIVDVRSITEFHLDLVQVQESILDSKLPHRVLGL